MYNLVIHSPVGGHLDYFHVLTIVNKSCDEHWGSRVFLNYGFLRVYAHDPQPWGLARKQASEEQWPRQKGWDLHPLP